MSVNESSNESVSLSESLNDPSYERFVAVLVGCAIASGVVLTVDGAVLDVVGAGSIPAKVGGGVSLILGIFGITGIYLVARASTSNPGCRHLDAGYFLNVAGLAAVVGISFAQNFVLDELDESVVEELVESGPTLGALIGAGVFAVIGFAVFGTALIRHRFDPLGAWAYTILIPISGFAAQMPPVVAAVAQGLGGLAIIRLGWVARKYLAAFNTSS